MACTSASMEPHRRGDSVASTDHRQHEQNRRHVQHRDRPDVVKLYFSPQDDNSESRPAGCRRTTTATRTMQVPHFRLPVKKKNLFALTSLAAAFTTTSAYGQTPNADPDSSGGAQKSSSSGRPRTTNPSSGDADPTKSVVQHEDRNHEPSSSSRAATMSSMELNAVSGSFQHLRGNTFTTDEEDEGAPAAGSDSAAVFLEPSMFRTAGGARRKKRKTKGASSPANANGEENNLNGCAAEHPCCRWGDVPWTWWNFDNYGGYHECDNDFSDPECDDEEQRILAEDGGCAAHIFSMDGTDAWIDTGGGGSSASKQAPRSVAEFDDGCSIQTDTGKSMKHPCCDYESRGWGNAFWSMGDGSQFTCAATSRCREDLPYGFDCKLGKNKFFYYEISTNDGEPKIVAKSSPGSNPPKEEEKSARAEPTRNRWSLPSWNGRPFCSGSNCASGYAHSDESDAFGPSAESSTAR
ncbi:unnamed protein product [Amoebophrya sp. A120]|nr:unnamed protein product [Amoebophrya sp. A120]|eukprot:GSA120T00020438001.1